MTEIEFKEDVNWLIERILSSNSPNTTLPNLQLFVAYEASYVYVF